MKRVQCSDINSQGFYQFRVFDTPRTVREFISEVLNHSDEWGTIELYFYTETVLHKYSLEYRDGLITGSNIDEEYKEKSIIKARGFGGYNRFDYDLLV